MTETDIDPKTMKLDEDDADKVHVNNQPVVECSVTSQLHMSHHKASYNFWRDVLGSPRYILAPMVDQSELAFRLLVRRYGVQCTYTPMFNANIFLKDHKYRRDSLQVLPSEDNPLIIQFCANNPETFLEAARIAAPYCQAIDLNLGCPQSIAKRGHYGAFLQDEWDLIHRIISLATKELNKPITAKFRIFPEIDKTVRYAKMLENAGAVLLSVHGRHREQKGPMTGLASWTHIKAVKEAVGVPVFANGNIQSLDDVRQCFLKTGVDGVMSAEGILHNPTIFSGKAISVWQATREYVQLASQHPCPFSYVRGHVFHFLHHCLLEPENAHLRRVVAKTHQFESLLNVANELELRYKTQYDQFVMENGLSECENSPPSSWPIFLCKPYYRPPPTQLNSKLVKDETIIKQDEQPISETNTQTKYSDNKCDSDQKNMPTRSENETTEKLSKRQKKKMEKFQRNKKLKIGDIEEEILAKKITQRRQLPLCCQCANPKGSRCEYNLCRTCCREKTISEATDCVGHANRLYNKNVLQIMKEKATLDNNSPTSTSELT